MSQSTYRRRAILSRVHKALDAFYMLQKIDWEYDLRSTLDRILGLALEEIELEAEKSIEHALVIVQSPDGEDLEVKAGWKVDEHDPSFSRTIVQQTFERSQAILCENAKDDPRFMNAESIKQLETLSLIAVPLQSEGSTIGVFYVESESAGNIFDSADLEFLTDFAETITPYVKTGLTHQGHVREIRKLQEEVSQKYSFGNIIGRSESIRDVFELVRIAASVDRTVLITGESGCGKELVAKAIHYNGHRRGGKFIVVDCSSLSENLLESELFGHVKGAFTGAAHDKVGAFEEANGGTLFLDEISDASKPMQQKLRRVLQEGEIKRVGDADVRSVDVRVICATNKELGDLVKAGEFIHDLYFRVNKFPIHIPPLRQRREDIPLLVQHFLDHQSEREGASEPQTISPDAIERLLEREWRENNIRELRNTVELAAELALGPRVESADLEKVFRIQSGGQLDATRLEFEESAPEATRLVEVHGRLFREMLEAELAAPEGEKRERTNTPFYRAQLEFEARVIVEALRCTQWKIRPASRVLGISPTKLRGSLKEYLTRSYDRAEEDVARLSELVDIPIEILHRKAKDLGLDALTGHATEKS